MMSLLLIAFVFAAQNIEAANINGKQGKTPKYRQT